MRRFAVMLLLVLGLASCGERKFGMAPVEELRWHPHNTHPMTHVVKRGETLYAIAFRYDRDFRQVAAYNHLRSPYSLRVGQVLRFQGGRAYYRHQPQRQIKSPVYTRQPAQSHSQSRPSYGGGRWYWPAKGRVVTNFLPLQGKKGIDIAGKKGDKIYASSSGVVAFSGSGLSGYGNLIIIKHNGQYLTAYGNNSRNLVKEGQSVKAGQVIADMGVIDRKFWGVHFEIRKAGQPVNPAGYLRN